MPSRQYLAYHEARASGLCVMHCGRKAARDRVKCPACLARDRDNAASHSVRRRSLCCERTLRFTASDPRPIVESWCVKCGRATGWVRVGAKGTTTTATLLPTT